MGWIKQANNSEVWKGSYLRLIFALHFQYDSSNLIYLILQQNVAILTSSYETFTVLKALICYYDKSFEPISTFIVDILSFSHNHLKHSDYCICHLL
jgi:hypothetical protein